MKKIILSTILALVSFGAKAHAEERVAYVVYQCDMIDLNTFNVLTSKAVTAYKVSHSTEIDPVVDFANPIDFLNGDLRHYFKVYMLSNMKISAFIATTKNDILMDNIQWKPYDKNDVPFSFSVSNEYVKVICKMGGKQ